MSVAPKEDRVNELTIFVRNLDPQVTERILYELMLQVAPVVRVKIPKDRVMQTSQGFGFVQFKTVQDAEYAERLFNNLMLFGRPIRIKRNSEPQATSKKVDVGAVLFVKNLDPLTDSETLMNTFKVFGDIISPPKIVRDEEGVSKGYGFITFSDFAASDRAKEEMDGQFFMNKELKIDYAFKTGSRTERHGDDAERLLARNGVENGAQSQ
ncbi:unnamed protein product [Kuraishia capsulata CBS 1993]|uniref:RRM domain-containing protein n=1 Tax=Kuraishia capsulata CBS 1993 TaxID=1382522 RepID=W6MSZ6_9ASCO|nr:uncharacterized protein KUCA_T00005940001 [Kuraishia capsulata CBS 1993]CDK29946.1 unnamed protein product [Kuraishia capsulata CBS 1993]